MRPPLRNRLRTPLAVGAGAGALVLAVALRNPHDAGSWGYCPFRLLTGQPCPLCGGLRAVHDLASGQLWDALSQNAAVTAALPLLAAAWVVWLVRRWRGTGNELPPLPAPSAALWVMAGLLVFGAVRLTGWGSWLAPS